MRISITTILLLFILITSSAQETKKVTIENEMPKTKEVFYVLKDRPEIKHGEYKRSYLGGIDVKEKGQYDNNVKVGIWEYYGKDGQLEQKIDFSNDSVIFSMPFKAMIKTMVLEDGGFKENNSPHVPIFLGGQSKFNHYLVKYLRYTAESRRMGAQGTVLISATINKEGQMIDEKVEQGIGFGMDEETLRIMKLLPDEWLPLKIAGAKVDARVFIEVKLRVM